MNELKIFKKEEFGNISVIVNDDEIWFFGKDVANILGYSDTQAMTRRLDEDEKNTYTDKSSGQGRRVTIINESGLYNAVLGSKKPEAKKFRKWVTISCII